MIIVVFAMMLFGVLGWTLARMQATNFESNLRTFEPENALNMAEAGAQWALNRLSADSSCRSQSGLLRCPPLAAPIIDSDCDEAGDWLTTPHSLSPGQYNLCVRNSCATCAPAESGNAVIVARGYIPAQSGSRVMRQIKLEVNLGSLSNVLQTQVPDPANPSIGLFDWINARADHTVQMEGNIEAGHYESDGDGVPDELPPGNPGYDYDSQPSPILPDDIFIPENESRNTSASYPSINMPDFYTLTPMANRWPNTDTVTAQITSISNGGLAPGYIQVGTNGFFSSMDDQAICLNIANWHLNDNNWRSITWVGGPSTTRARVNSSVAGIWAVGQTIQLVRRFASGMGIGAGIWYIGREAFGTGGPKVDTLIDLTDNSLTLNNRYIICEGNIIIKGLNTLNMSLTGSPSALRYPRLATKTGKIYSTERLEDLFFGNPAPFFEYQRMLRRIISGLIYSEFGEVNFNYLRAQNTGNPLLQRTLVYGSEVTLDGRIYLRYGANVISITGFVFEPATLTWKEE